MADAATGGIVTPETTELLVRALGELGAVAREPVVAVKVAQTTGVCMRIMGSLVLDGADVSGPPQIPDEVWAAVPADFRVLALTAMAVTMMQKLADLENR